MGAMMRAEASAPQALSRRFQHGLAGEWLGIDSIRPDNAAMDEKQRGFQFPGEFEIAAMGAADAGLERLLPETLDALGLAVVPDSLRTRPSSKGNFVSVTVRFEAQSRDDYDAAHGALRARPEVKWTL